ncbi:PQQ-like beta-propeller repeat protein [candidate division WOR-3 bacterium]|nr:PQQ-like beta-propeller repeat protein [candidate division WOR-3 bacterium]
MSLQRILPAAALAASAILFTSCKNPPPSPPEITSGPSLGGAFVSQKFVAANPNSGDVAIRFSWGDGDTSAWSEPLGAGDSLMLTHFWYNTGTYIVKAQAQAAGGSTSEWSDSCRITLMPVGILKWRFDNILGSGISSPAIAPDGTVLFAAGWVRAFTPNGTRKWQHETGGWGAPAIANDGTIYIGAQDSCLRALAASGSFKWEYRTGGVVCASPAIDQAGMIYVGSCDSCLYAIRPDGSLKWRYEASDLFAASPAVAADGTVYVGSFDGWLHALSPDGDVKWKFRVGLGGFISSPSIGTDGTVYVGNGSLCALNPDGTVKWTNEEARIEYSTVAIGPDGTLYAGSEDNCLLAIGPDGVLKWRHDTGKHVRSSPAIGQDGTVYFGMCNYICAVGPDGYLRWSYETEDEVESSPALGPDGTLYIGSHDGYFYAIEAANPLADAPWPSFRHDNLNSGRADVGL